ncbi:MAG TPA: dihydrolipoamide acetyltransferase family protein [Ktedonobacterales bacterium]
MATNVILPVLGMAQDTGKIVEWLKAEGQHVTAGEALVVIETDKAAVDLEAPATGILARVSAQAGDEVPVAQVIAVILTPEEAAGETSPPSPLSLRGEGGAESRTVPDRSLAGAGGLSGGTPLGADKSAGPPSAAVAAPSSTVEQGAPDGNGRRLASPKARRIAAERGVELAAIRGSGPGGVVLAADVLAAEPVASAVATLPAPHNVSGEPAPGAAAATSTTSTIWRLMAERTTQSWTTIPHFFLVREVSAEALVAWRERAARDTREKVTYTDLLVRVVAAALRRHPRLNASWQQGVVTLNDEINIGLAVAVAEGLVVPVIHQADDLTLGGIARRRADLVARAQASRLRPRDLADGTFTISNLGMYGVDAFNAIINAPQAAILAVGRVAERVVPVNGQPAVRLTMTLSLSCDHRVVDGARGAEFLATVAALIEDPSSLER